MRSGQGLGGGVGRDRGGQEGPGGPGGARGAGGGQGGQGGRGGQGGVRAARKGKGAFFAFFFPLWKGSAQGRHQNSAFSGRGPGGSGGVS